MSIVSKTASIEKAKLLGPNEKRILLYLGDGRNADKEGYTQCKRIEMWAEDNNFIYFDPTEKLKDAGLIQRPPGTVHERFGLTEAGHHAYDYFDELRRKEEISQGRGKPKAQEADDGEEAEKEGGSSGSAAEGEGVDPDADGAKGAKAGRAGSKRSGNRGRSASE